MRTASVTKKGIGSVTVSFVTGAIEIREIEKGRGKDLRVVAHQQVEIDDLPQVIAEAAVTDLHPLLTAACAPEKISTEETEEAQFEKTVRTDPSPSTRDKMIADLAAETIAATTTL